MTPITDGNPVGPIHLLGDILVASRFGELCRSSYEHLCGGVYVDVGSILALLGRGQHTNWIAG